MKNSKGFTLVELLAAVVILGILTAFSVPSIMKVITNNRDKTYREDAKKMVTLAESRIRSGNVVKLAKEECMIITMNGLKSGEFKKAPNGGEYDKNESFVLIKRDKINTSSSMPQYAYYVYLVEKYGNDRYRGVDFQQISNDANISKNTDNTYEIDIKNFNQAENFSIASGDLSSLNTQLDDIDGVGDCIQSEKYIIK